MTGIYREEFSRAFSSKRWWLIALLAALSFAYGLSRAVEAQQGSPVGAVIIWQLILWRGAYGFFAALTAALPFADSLLTDRRHHFIDQVLVRSTYRDYLKAKTLATLVSGMAAVMLPAVILLAGCLLFIPPAPPVVPELYFGLNEILNPNVIEAGTALAISEAGYLAICLGMLALFGAAYALLGLASSFVIRNPFVVMGLPFIVYSLGYFILPTSVRLSWLGSTEASLIPTANLISPVSQYLAAALVFGACLLLWSAKDRMLMD
jgi:hypothetical protein